METRSRTAKAVTNKGSVQKVLKSKATVSRKVTASKTKKVVAVSSDKIPADQNKQLEPEDQQQPDSVQKVLKPKATVSRKAAVSKTKKAVPVSSNKIPTKQNEEPEGQQEKEAVPPETPTLFDKLLGQHSQGVKTYSRKPSSIKRQVVSVQQEEKNDVILKRTRNTQVKKKETLVSGTATKSKRTASGRK